jgi:hypothetical protein
MAAVRKLAENLRTVCVDGIRNFPQQRNDRVPRVNKAAGHFAGRMDGLALDDDQPDATSRAFLVIGDMRVGWLTLERAEGGEMGLENEAIAQLNNAYSKRVNSSGNRSVRTEADGFFSFIRDNVLTLHFTPRCCS